MREFFFEKSVEFLDFFRFTLRFRIFQSKKKIQNFFSQISHSFFANSVGQLYTRAAVKELDFRAEAGAVSSLRAESELQLRLSF